MENNRGRGNASGRGGNDKRNTRGGSGRDGQKPSYGKPGSFAGKKPYGDKPWQLKKAEAKKAKESAKPESDEIRLNKYISNSGMCSRRDADMYIQSGNVKVNGHVVTEMGYKVKLTDKVEFDGAVIKPEKKEYLLLNKPKNFTTGGDAEKGLRHVSELVKNASTASLEPVGRMDKNTTGLLLFTNDSDMLRKFTQPNQKSFKIYQVSLDKNLKSEDLEKMSKGVELDGHRLFIDEITYIENSPRTEIGLKLRTPNVRVVRSIFESFGYTVVKVDRVFFAGLTKKNLPRGNYRFLNEQEIINLKNI